ncbi:MAG: Hint domain-containing protein, partial [Pseudomonadota bacterium]
MATYNFEGYAPSAIQFLNGATGFATNSSAIGQQFRIDPDFESATDRYDYEVTEPGGGDQLSGDQGASEVGEDTDQYGTVRDADGNIVAGGPNTLIYGEHAYSVQAPDGSIINFYTIEVAGQDMGIVADAPLQPGVTYEIVSEKNITPGDEPFYNTFADVDYDPDASNDIEGGRHGDDLRGGGSDDTIEGGGGDDTIDGGDGGDHIQGDHGGAAARVGFKWSDVPDPDDGGQIDDEDTTDSGSQTVGGVDVTFDFTGTGQNDGYETADNYVAGIDAGGQTVDANSSWQIGGAHDETARMDLRFSEDVENVAFRINDLDFNADQQEQVTVQAFDLNGNAIPVTVTFGSNLIASDTDTVAGNETGTGTGAQGASDEAGSMLVEIAGPVAQIVITYVDLDTSDGGGLVNITDIWFDEPEDAGDDVIDGGAGDDTIDGGAGDDEISGGTGADHLSGGNGSDTFAAEDGFGNDTIVGGAGEDAIDLSALSGPVTVTYTGTDAGTITNGSDTITFSEVERLVLTDHDDSVGGSSSGAMHIDARGGNDSIDAGAGDDTILGGDGADTIQGDRGNDSIDGGEGDDSLAGELDDDTLDGGDGDDTLNGGGGDDSLIGGAGQDSILGASGADTIRAGDGDDVVKGGSDDDNVFGGDGADRIQGDNGDDSLLGEGGDDTLSGGEGADTLDGGAGSDLLTGNAGNDEITTGAGSDTVALSEGGGADIVTDFDLGDDDGDGFTNDQLDVSDLTNGAGQPITASDVTVTDDGFGNALLTFPEGESVVLQGVSPGQASGAQAMHSMGIPCFTAGTCIRTPAGTVPIQTLRVGDLVITRDNGPKPIRWIGHSTLGALDLAAHPKRRPVLIQPGALGNDRPVLVSPNHGLLCADPDRPGDEILARAIHLARLPGSRLRVATGKRGVTYIHLLFDRHEIIFSDGIPSESFYPG